MDRTDEPGGPIVEGRPAPTWVAPRPAVVTAEVGTLRRISWGAVFAGVVIALVAQLAFTLLGLAIGFGTLHPYTETNTFQGFGSGAAIWLVCTTLVALFCGGLVAGRLAGVGRRFDGALHGIVAWGLVTLASAWLMTTAAGRLVSGAVGVVGDVAGAVGQGVAAVAPAAQNALPNVSMQDIGNRVKEFLRQTGDPALQPGALQQQGQQAVGEAQTAAGNVATQPSNAGDTIEQAFSRLAQRGEAIVNQVDREDAINVVMRQTGKSRDESAAIVDNWIGTFQQARANAGQTAYNARAQAERVGENVAGTLSQASAWGFVALLLGAAAAAVGGALGFPRNRGYFATPTEH